MLAGGLCIIKKEKGCRPFPRTPFSAISALPTLALRIAPDKFFLTKPNTSGTIKVPASLRSERCSPSARNTVRVVVGISVRLRRNPQLQIMRKILLGVHPTRIPQGNTQSCPCSVNVQAQDLTSCGHGSNVIEWQDPSSGGRCSNSSIPDSYLNFKPENDAFYDFPTRSLQLLAQCQSRGYVLRDVRSCCPYRL